MTCDQTAQIHAYHDGDLSPTERAAVETHLRSCDSCRELLSDLQHISRLMASAALVEMPPRAINRMYGAWWASAQARDRGVRRLAGWLTAAAAAVLVLVPLYSPYSPSRPAEFEAGSWQETIAFIPPAGPRDDANAELIQVAQWIANDLSTEQPSLGPQQ
jgi:anti-sigma factor RsiW